jgi:hypothetical protein
LTFTTAFMPVWERFWHMVFVETGWGRLWVSNFLTWEVLSAFWKAIKQTT